MRIFVLTPMCLLLALAKFGDQNNHYYLLREDSNVSRHRGRNLNLRHELLLKMFHQRNIPFQEVTELDLIGIFSTSTEDFAVDFQLAGRFQRLNLIPLRNYMRGRKLFLLSFGADNLIPFGRFLDTFRSPKSFKEIVIWKKFLKILQADFMLVPSIKNLPSKKYGKTVLSAVPLNKLNNSEYTYLHKLTSDLLFSNSELNDSQLLIIAPDNSAYNRNHLSALAAEARRLLTKTETEISILFKPHPASKSAPEELAFIESELGSKTFNTLSTIDLEALKSVPLEFLFIAYPSSLYVGTPSASLALIPDRQISLVRTFNKKLDNLLLRSFRAFFSLHEISPEAWRN